MASPTGTSPSNSPNDRSPAKSEAPRPSRLWILLNKVKIVDVIRYILTFITNLIGGRERLGRDPKDVVNRLLSMVWPVMLAPVNSPEAAGRLEIIGVFCLALARTILMEKSTTIVRTLTTAVYKKDMASFSALLTQAIVMVGLGATCSSLLSFCKEKLCILWREKITSEIHNRYFSTMNYYNLTTTKKPRPIFDADERLAREVTSVTGRLVNLVFLLLKSLPPIIYFTIKLARSQGLKQAMIPHVYLLLAYEGAQRVFPKNIGELWRNQLAAQGGYTKTATRIQTHSEAIAALDGAKTESAILNNAYSKVSGAANALNFANHKKDLVFKLAYSYGCRSWIASFILLPILRRPEGSKEGIGELMATARYSTEVMIEMLIGNGNLLTLHATALYLRPSAKRLCDLLDTLDELGRAHTKMGTTSLVEGESIKFDGVDIVTPAGQPLVHDLNFELKQGGALLLTGHNGAGKSSIFRCLGGLWSVPKGVISKPGAGQDGLCSEIFYLPQRPYNVLGTLVDQLSYPAPPSSVKITDDELRSLLAKVDLLHLLDQEYNKDGLTNWEDRLSLGEQQRLAMARLFYHNPKFAILDECTSAVSSDMEKLLYAECQRRGITYITICHRPALKAYHSTNLHLLGEGSNGGWEHHELGEVKPLDIPTLHHIAPRASSSASQREFAVAPLPRRRFISKIVKILRVMLPGSYGKLILLLAGILARTLLHESYARVTGALMRSAIEKNAAMFGRFAAFNVAQDLLAAVVDEGILFLQSKISIQWHEAMARHAQALFLKNNAFYRLKNIDRRIQDPDQRLTQEIQELSEHFSAIVARSIQPLANVLWFSWRISRHLSGKEMMPLYGYVTIVWTLLKFFMPDHEGLKRKEQELEGQFRFVHTRLRTHAESIAFFGGGSREKAIADTHLANLLKHQRFARLQEILFQSMRLLLTKDHEDPSHMVTSSALVALYMQLKVSMGASNSAVLPEIQAHVKEGVDRTVESFSKLAGLYEHLSKLMGSSTRVCELLDVLEEQATAPAIVNSGCSKDIVLDDVHIDTPDGERIVSHLAVQVQPGKSLLVTGHNGVGKSSLFRVIAGLWPVLHGKVVRPEGGVFLVPQRVYSVTGTLADQVTYPLRFRPLTKAVEEQVLDCLKTVGIERLATRERKQILSMPADQIVQVGKKKKEIELGFKVSLVVKPDLIEMRGVAASCEKAVGALTGMGLKVRVASDAPAGLEKEQEWENVLSLGEQQRIGIARVFFHKPHFVVLDECTDAVSMDVERQLYTDILGSGTTCITISKRLALPEFHSQQLQLGADTPNAWKVVDLN